MKPRQAPLGAVRRAVDAAFRRAGRATPSVTRRRFLGMVLAERPRQRP